MGFSCLQQTENVSPLKFAIVFRAAAEKESSFCMHHLLISELSFYREDTHLLNMIL